MASLLNSFRGGRRSGDPEDEDENDLGKQSKADLLSTIQELTEKNSRFELRFRDVVQAYKSLQKENQALKATLAAGAPQPQLEASVLLPPPTPSSSDLLSTSAISPASEPSTPARGSSANLQELSNGGGLTPATTDPLSASEAPSTPRSSTPPPPQPSQTPLPSAATIAELQARIESLRTAVATVTTEKANLEARFQNDKKVVLEAHRQALHAARTEAAEAMRAKDATIQSLQEEKQLFAEQIEALTQQVLAGHDALLEKEAGWHKERRAHGEEIAALLRQKHDAERSQDVVRELEGKLQKARDAELDALTQLSTSTEGLRTRVSQLEDELSQARAQLAAAQSRGESDELLRLKADLRNAKKQAEVHRQAAVDAGRAQAEASHAAQERVMEAEARLAATLRQQEERQGMDQRERMLLEARLSELSALIGRYETARLDDHRSIMELRESNMDLQDETKSLREQLLALGHIPAKEGSSTGGSHGSNGNAGKGAGRENGDGTHSQQQQQHGQTQQQQQQQQQHMEKETIQTLNDKITKLKALLFIANQRLAESKDGGSRTGGGKDDDQAVDLPVPSFLRQPAEGEDGLQQGSDVPSSSSPLPASRDEVEMYYLRAKALVKENNELTRQIAVLTRARDLAEEKAAKLKVAKDEALKEACERWESENEALRRQLREEVARLEVVRQKDLVEMQKRNQRARERTIAVLADRDAEIARLRQLLGHAKDPLEPMFARSPSGRDSAVDDDDVFRPSAPDLASAVESGTTGGGTAATTAAALHGLTSGSAGGPLVHIATLEAQRADERSASRARIRELEGALSDLQEKLALQSDQMNALKEEIRRLERNARREGANLEYLKNIFLRYIESPVGRDQTITAISTILQFSPTELARAKKGSKSSWWASPLSP